MANDAPILIDVSRLIWRRWAGRHPTGIDRVCLAYLRHFAPRAQAVVQHPRYRRILGTGASRRLFEILEKPPVSFRTSLVRSVLRHSVELKRAPRGEGRYYLNIGHTGLDQDGFSAWTREADVRPVYFVHDLIPISHPEYCRAGESERHKKRVRTILATAAGIIGNSQATLDALGEFQREETLPSRPQLAAPLSGTPLPYPQSAASAERPTFVVLGTIEARKNHLLLLNIWTRLVSRMGEQAPQLLIIGQRGWEAEQAFAILDRSTLLRGHVVELNDCSDDELARRLASARALLFPSMVEGYGLPLIEALGAGVPVIASDLPVFREIGQGIPIYLSPIDGIGWERAIMDFAVDNSAARAAQLARMKQVKLPDWNNHFRAVENWLPTL